MVISKKKEIPNVKIELDGKEAQQVSKFVHLGELITENGIAKKKSEEESKLQGNPSPKCGRY